MKFRSVERTDRLRSSMTHPERSIAKGIDPSTGDVINYYEYHPKSLHEDDWFRADGSIICDTCKKPYRKHPLYPHLVDQDSNPWLHELCDGSLVKL